MSETAHRRMDPAFHFEAAYETNEPELAFQAKSKDEFFAWQKEAMERLTELVGGFPGERVPLDLEVLERVELETHRRDKVVFQSAADVSVPAYILYPKGGTCPYPAVVQLHGHGAGKTGAVGLQPDGSPRQGDPDYHNNVAIRLVEQGMVVIAPDQAGFGERRSPEAAAQGDNANSCRSLSFFAQLLGRTLIGLRVWDVMRAIDLLETLPEVDAKRIGCIGVSGGGMTTLFASALEPRIQAAVVICYLNTFRDSILAMRHCECNYVPGILRYMEMPDIACAIAPRALFVEAGTEDRIFPINATRLAVAQAKKAYAVVGAEDRFDADLFDGGHTINGRRSVAWLAKQLGAATS